MFKVYEENKKLKKEIEDLRKNYDIVSLQNNMIFNENSHYESKIEELKKETNELQKEIVELSEKNYELAKKLTNDTTGKIKEFINELEHTVPEDKKTDEILVSGVAWNNVIERLKDIIK